MLQILLTALFITLTLTACYRVSIFSQLRSRQDHLVLERKTNDLKIRDILLVILLLLVENFKRLFSRGSRTLSPRHGASTLKRSVLEFPSVSVTMGLDVKLEDIQQYQRAVGWKLDSSHTRSDVKTHVPARNNAHLALFLSAISGPALLLLLARPICPINPLGAVNVRNLIRIIDPGRCRTIIEGMMTSTTSNGLIVRAAPNREARQVRRGMEVDIRVVIIMHEDGPNTEPQGIEIFEQVFTVLEFGKTSPAASTDRSSIKANSSGGPKNSSLLVDVSKRDLREAPQLASYFKIKLSDPSQWAWLGKDYNPIHISSLAAKLFGFRSKIAHGNHAVAKALHVLYQSGDEQFLRFCHLNDEQQLWMQIEFKRPILLPAEVGVRTTDASHSMGKNYHQNAALEVFAGDKVYAEAIMGCVKA